MPQSCYYRLGCFGPRAFFFCYQSRYGTATCANNWAALFKFLFHLQLQNMSQVRIWDNSCSGFQCKIKEWALWALWCAVRHCLSPRVLFMNPANGHPPPPSIFSSIPIITPIHSSTCTYWDRVIFLFLYQSIGVKPDKSPGDPAARVFALH